MAAKDKLGSLDLEDSLEGKLDLSSSNSHKSFVTPIRLSKKSILPGSAVRQSPKSPILLQPPDRTPLQEFHKFITEADIAFEYKLLMKHSPNGVYIHPSEKSIREWHGVIFLHSGLYEAGIFKFTIYLTDGFPKSRPIIKFISHVVHPLIHPKTGIFNYSREFPSWTPHQDHIWKVLQYMKRCFYDSTTWLTEDEDAEEYKNEKYKRKIQSSVQDSLIQVNHPKFDGKI
jgi:ubiquitin-protein ligase